MLASPQFINPLIYHLRMAALWTLCLILTLPQSASPSEQSIETKTDAQHRLSKWEEAAEARYKSLIAKNGNGSDITLRTKLLQMGEQDQRVRQFMMTLPQDRWTPDMQKELARTDEELTAKLKTIVSENGWPTMSMVGVKASEDAMLILIHTSDHAWQSAMIPRLERLADNDEIVGSGLAVVIDKGLVAAGVKQRFGTQFKFEDGEMAMYAVEDPAQLDDLRAKWLLPPVDVYKQMMLQIYPKLKMTNKVVSPEPHAQQETTQDP